jgi:hypothetical protein
MKSSPHLGPTRGPQPMTSQPSPMQRAMMNRQQAARSSSTSIVPPLQPVNTMTQGGPEHAFAHSPTFPRNHSQTSSPSTTRSPGFHTQGGTSSPTSHFPVQQMPPQQRPHIRPQRNSFTQHSSAPRPGSGQLTTPPGPMQGTSSSRTTVL